MIAFTGLTVPSALETCDTATIFVFPERRFSSSSIRISPRSLIGATASFAPFSSQSICHGTMLEWCSSAEIRTSSPARTFDRPYVCATRLIPSVVPRTKTISRVSPALMKSRIFSRAFS